MYTKPIHGTQKAKWIDDHTLDVRINVKINTELKRILLSYVPYITILSPQSLVDSHKESLRKALEQYK
ncbi:MAG: WYL domain-containing protein [Bacteroidales bacterium]|nr:WYL domain-containing protein [Bacteroidales bacterium]